MNISEMTLEQLQDLAIKQQEEIAGLKTEKAQLLTKQGELTELNTTLQKRNNELFLKVEQGVMPGPTEEKPVEPKESLEDFGKNLVLNNKI